MSINELEIRIRSVLQLKQGSSGLLRNRESSQFEFKETFNLGSRSKYARTMSAFANARGGYVVFGVEPSPHRLRGVNVARFEQTDSSKLTEFLNACFSPELQWEMAILNVFGFDLGYIYTHEASEKPIICIQNNGDELKDGCIYYRYNAQTTVIRYPELRRIFEERLGRERRAWMQHFKTISKAGPTNVGILDTIHGKIYGAGQPFLIDEKLVRDFRFVRKGSFSDIEGAPTLKLVGEVQSVSGLTPIRRVAVSIHVDDLITAFLAQRQISASDAKTYIQEAAHQSTAFVPIHYFVNAAKLTPKECTELIKQVNSPFNVTKAKLLRRVVRDEVVKPTGLILATTPTLKNLSRDTLAQLLSECASQAEKRTMIFETLKTKPLLIRQSLGDLPITRLCEAVTHLTTKQIASIRKDILELLLIMFTEMYSGMNSGEKGAFRRAVAHLDELLNN
jgi:schlafen family protein